MRKNKLWYSNSKQQLYPLLSTESPFHHIASIKLEAERITGASTLQLNENYNHYIITERELTPNKYTQSILTEMTIDKHDPDQLLKRLKQYGLHTYKKLPDERLFLFRIMHLKTLVWSRVNHNLNLINKPFVVTRTKADLIMHNDQVLSEIIVRQAETVASRALYATGIDIGSVLLAISGTGTIAVRQVYSIDQPLSIDDEKEVKQALRLWQLNRARPQQASDSIINFQAYSTIKYDTKHKAKPLIINKAIVQANADEQLTVNTPMEVEEKYSLERYYEPFMYDEDNELWLGADPELIFLNEKNEMVPAVDILIDDPQGRYGFDSVINDQQVTFPVAEIRPDPQRTPQLLVKEIESILVDMSQFGIDQQYQWFAGGMPKGLIALGGHVHFSGLQLTPSLLRLLDSCLALTFSLIEDNKSSELRRHKYGALGDFRRQEHGGFEYRTLPSWLVSPQMTRGAIALGYLIIKEQDILKQNIKSDYDVFEAYNIRHMARIREHINHVFDVLVTLNSYSEVEEWLLPLKDMVNDRKRWNEAEDIRQNWQLLVNS